MSGYFAFLLNNAVKKGKEMLVFTAFAAFAE